MFSLIEVLLIAIVAAVTAVYYYFWNRSQYFKRRGIPGPAPSSIFTGNLRELQRNRNPAQQLVEWEKEYGGTYGIMEGGNKMIVTDDLNILQDVFLRKFEHFHGRKSNLNTAFDPDKEKRINVFNARGLRWKRLRTITNPTFSAAKLKAMEPVIQDSIKALMNELEKTKEAPFDIYPRFQELTLDVIERVAFGKSETQFGKTEKNFYIDLLRKFFNPLPTTDSWIQSFFASTPEFVSVTRYLAKVLLLVRNSPFRSIILPLEKVVEQRRHSLVESNGHHESAPNDFINLFLHAEADDDDMQRLTDERHREVERKHLKVEKKLTIGEIVAQCFVFLVAGYDTTANTLAYLAYNLSMNDEAQDKLIAEIDDFLANEGDINYDSVQNLKYLDWCLKESLRMNPLASIANARMCMKECTVGDRQKLHVEEGVCIQSNVWAIHYRKDVWGEDADKFRPERFDPEQIETPRHPLAWQPFGAGPRTCIGMRFALLEAKMTICHLLKRFRIEKCDKTTLVRTGILTVGPTDVTVILKKRPSIESD